MGTCILFENFVTASTFRSIQNSFYQLCISLDIDPTDSINVYPKLRCLDEWKAQKLWKLLDKKWELAEYKKQKPGELLNVFVIGAGPCGLRSAIECALLGCRVVLVEQRDRFSRNNVLHLWEFVIQDLKSLGAKIFYPKFCTGSIEHISIRQLQCILLKVALCFGVQIHESVTFVQLLFPKKENDTVTGFRACVAPKGHILSDYDIDVLIAADGKRNTIPGFPREEMRGKLAIGITANFVNNKTAAEERVPEISGVAYIFNQAFFKEMYAKTGVDLENIVYYKDETHYFVMCAKKQSLLEMGVILQDNDDISQLLSSRNVDQEALCHYAQAAADFATNGKLPALNYARNHRGNEDIAMFDFTSLYSSKCSVRLVERMGKCLLMGIVGDSLHEPFWPTGSGCARGFLGVLDTAWLIREFGLNTRGPLEMIAERESIYRLLAQVTKDNINKAINKYTIDPKTRYVSYETALQPEDVVQIVSSDNPRLAPISQPLKMNNSCSVHQDPSLKAYSVWKFCQQALSIYKIKMFDMNSCWNDGRAVAGLVARFRPELIDYFRVVCLESPEEKLQLVFKLVKEAFHIASPCSPMEWCDLTTSEKVEYIGEIVDYLKNDAIRFKNAVITPRHYAVQKRKVQTVVCSNPKRSEPIQKLAENLLSCGSFNVAGVRSVEGTKTQSGIADQVNLQNENVNPNTGVHIYRRYSFKTMDEQKNSSSDATPPGLSKQTKIMEKNREAVVIRPVAPVQPERHLSTPTVYTPYDSVNAKRQETCQMCKKVVYLAERMQVESMYLHKNCFRCAYCCQPLRIGECGKDKDFDRHYPGRFFCNTHLRLPLQEKIARVQRSLRTQENSAVREQDLPNAHKEVGLYRAHASLEADACIPASETSVQCSATLSFFPPEQLQDRRTKRIRDSALANVQTVPFSPVSEIPFIDDRTPERAEFSIHERKSSTVTNHDETKLEVNAELSSSSSDSEEDFEENEASKTLLSKENLPERSDVDEGASFSEEEGDDLDEGDLNELERTVLQYSEENPDRPLTEEQVVSVIENINRRRNAPQGTPKKSPAAPENDPISIIPECKYDAAEHESVLNFMDSEAFVTIPNKVFTDLRKKKAAELELIRTESRLKAKQKSDEELGLENAVVKRKSVAVIDLMEPSTSRSNNENRAQITKKMSEQTSTGMHEFENKQGNADYNALRRPINNEVVHSESRKETNILGNAVRRFKLRRAQSRDTLSSSTASSPNGSPRAAVASPDIGLESRDVPCAAVAPSPRHSIGVADEFDSPTHITVNERNIKLFHKRAEKIRRQHDDERRRGAQEIQRGLQECEIRLEEIKAVGQSLELKLIEDPENEWAMDSWFALVHEYELLKSREEMLRLSKREVELEVKYRDLNLRFKQLGEGMNDNLSANSDLLAAMLAVVEEKKEVNKLFENAKCSCKAVNAHIKALRERGRNFDRFKPLFSSQ